MAANPPRHDPERIGTEPFPEGAAGREENPENPLLMEDVLDNVLGYLDFDSLRQGRVVNPLWNLAGGRLLSPRCGPIKFLNASELDYRRNGKGIGDMGQLVNLLNTSWNFPCTKFTVSCGIATIPEDEQILTSFFQVVGPSATHLEILDRTDGGIPLFGGPQPQGIKYRALKSLTVTFYFVDSVPENLQSNLEFLGNVLDHAPNLCCLHLNAFSDNNRAVVTSTLALLERVNCSKICDFSFHGDMKNDHLNKILDLGVTKLQKLHILISYEATVDAETLKIFLRSQSESLETLHLETMEFRRQIVLELPRLPKLKKLTVQGFYTEETTESIPLSFSRVCYKRQFPVLKSLTVVENFDHNLKEFVNNEIQPTETVEELELPEDADDEEEDREAIVRNAARIFPKLRKLKAPSQSRVMRPAYEAFGCVEELTLYDGTYYDDFQSPDSLLTQFTEEECNQARNFPERLAELVERNTEPLPFLKRLKVLRIIQQNGERGFSDVSCRVILLKLDALKCLKLVGTFSDRVLTEPVICEMKEKFRVEFEKGD